MSGPLLARNQLRRGERISLRRTHCWRCLNNIKMETNDHHWHTQAQRCLTLTSFLIFTWICPLWSCVQFPFPLEKTITGLEPALKIFWLGCHQVKELQSKCWGAAIGISQLRGGEDKLWGELSISTLGERSSAGKCPREGNTFFKLGINLRTEFLQGRRLCCLVKSLARKDKLETD